MTKELADLSAELVLLIGEALQVEKSEEGHEKQSRSKKLIR